MKHEELTNEQLLDRASSTFEHREHQLGLLDQLRSERDMQLAEVNTRINAAQCDLDRAEAEHRGVMRELAMRMIAYKVRTIRDWRGTFHLEEVSDGADPQAHFVSGDGGHISWLDWTSLQPYPAACPSPTSLDLGNVA